MLTSVDKEFVLIACYICFMLLIVTAFGVSLLQQHHNYGKALKEYCRRSDRGEFVRIKQHWYGFSVVFSKPEHITNYGSAMDEYRRRKHAGENVRVVQGKLAWYVETK